MAKSKKSREPEPSGMSPALWAVPLLAILNLLLYLAFTLRYIEPFIVSLYYWKMGTILFQLVLLLVLVGSHALDRRSAAPAEEDEDEEEEPMDVSAEVVEVKAEMVEEKPKAAVKAAAKTEDEGVEKAPELKATAGPVDMVEYPKKESGGIYADTKIQVGAGKVLKLRTMVARSCLLCDSQEKCWALVRHDHDLNDFKANIDCKAGLGVGS